MARFIHTTILSAAALSALALTACGRPASTVTASTGNVTGCPAANLATFNYHKSAATWQAVCGEQLMECSGRGKQQCTPVAADPSNAELRARAALVLQVPQSRREFFVSTNLMEGTWQEFARNAAVVAALNDAQFKQVDDTRTVFTGFSAAFNQQLASCLGLSKVAHVSPSSDGTITAGRGAPSCMAVLAGSPELAPLRGYAGTTFILAPNVRDLKIAAQPAAGSTKPGPTPEELEAQRIAEEQAKLKAEQELAAKRQAEVEAWLDGSQKALTTCTGLKEIPVDVVIDDQGVVAVTLQGKLNTPNKAKCVNAALGQKTFEGGARTLSYVAGAPKPAPDAAASAPAATPATTTTPAAAPAAAPVPAPTPVTVTPTAPAAPAGAAPAPAVAPK